MIFILTDASPNDSMPLKSLRMGTKVQEYEGIAAVEDAKKSVKNLRKHGINISAVFLGSSIHLDNVSVIYGDEYVRLLSMRQLSDGISSLYRRALQK